MSRVHAEHGPGRAAVPMTSATGLPGAQGVLCWAAYGASLPPGLVLHSRARSPAVSPHRRHGRSSVLIRRCQSLDPDPGFTGCALSAGGSECFRDDGLPVGWPAVAAGSPAVTAALTFLPGLRGAPPGYGPALPSLSRAPNWDDLPDWIALFAAQEHPRSGDEWLPPPRAALAAMLTAWPSRGDWCIRRRRRSG